MSNVVWGFPNEQAIIIPESQSKVDFLGYKSYVFSVHQTNAGTWVFNTIEKTFSSGFQWQEQQPGQYALTFGETVNGAKIYISGGGGNFYGAGNSVIPIYNLGNSTQYNVYLYPVVSGPIVSQTNWPSSGIMMEVTENTNTLVGLEEALGTQVDPGPGSLVGNIIIEIRAYL